MPFNPSKPSQPSRQQPQRQGVAATLDPLSRQPGVIESKSKSTAESMPGANDAQPDRVEQFVPETPHRSIDDLVMTDKVSTRLQAALNQIRFHHVLYDEWNLQKVDPNGRRVAINLYGAPGTGKSFCAEAIAHHLGKPLIRVNYAEIESKYVGETPKNITTAFDKASETGAVLFFDEADSILGKRLTNVTQSADHSVNVSRSVMLLQLDRFDGVVVFASNLPKNYDGAFVRRILAHIEFELPDQDCLVKLWQFLLPTELPRSEELTSDWLAEQSLGLAGGDIVNVIKLAASQAVSREGSARQILATDVESAIAQVRQGKEKVGHLLDGDRLSTVQETVVPPEELPKDVQEEYRTRANVQPAS
jgi:SpoVK/Ycf46/Vps4 family AAA+-type ATPase